MPMTRNKRPGFHIATSALSPNTTYRGKEGGLVPSPYAVAILFFTHEAAYEFARQHGIVLGYARNIVMPCECPENICDQHPDYVGI